MTINFLECNSSCFGGYRNTGAIKYLVYHYTATPGATAHNEATYFHNRVENRVNYKSSAHYFVDDTSVWQSVRDDRVAYAVGGKAGSHLPFYGICTNANSISIEMCINRNGVITEATLTNAIELGKQICQRYGIPQSRVLRHYDVSGKLCPNANGLLNDATFNAFKSRIFTTYKEGWMKNSVGWWYQYSNGSWLANEWKLINNKWYYFNARGYAVTGWQYINNKWYYFDTTNCDMLKGWQHINYNGSMRWFYFTKDGAMVNGVYELEWQGVKKLYAFDNNGCLIQNGTGEAVIYANPDGSVKVG